MFLVQFSGCFQGSGEEQEVEFDGRGQGHVAAIAMIIDGEVQHQDFTGGEIFIEIRQTFSCAHGRCPIIGTDPMTLERLTAPGPFSIHLTERTENLMIIASYFPNSGGVRIAHEMIPNGQDQIHDLILSLDRPFSPLR